MSLLCKLLGHKEFETLSGYPAYSHVWVIHSECSRCGMKFKTTDDLFAPQRPDNMPIHMDFMINKR